MGRTDPSGQETRRRKKRVRPDPAVGAGDYMPGDDPRRAPWILDLPEIVVAALAAAAIGWGWFNFIPPVVLVPLAAFLAAGGVSLVRLVRNNVRYFSRAGHLAMAWPALSFFPLHLALLVDWALFLLLFGGLTLSLWIAIRGYGLKTGAGDYIPLPYNLLWTLFVLTYLQALITGLRA